MNYVSFAYCVEKLRNKCPSQARILQIGSPSWGEIAIWVEFWAGKMLQYFILFAFLPDCALSFVHIPLDLEGGALLFLQIVGWLGQDSTGKTRPLRQWKKKRFWCIWGDFFERTVYFLVVLSVFLQFFRPIIRILSLNHHNRSQITIINSSPSTTDYSQLPITNHSLIINH
jgi:hypothetical protein